MMPRISPRISPRTLALTALLGLLAPELVHAQLAYLDASPAGASFPEWDGGDTELEFADINGDGHVDFLSIGDHGSPFINTNEHGVMAYFGDGAGGWSIHMEGNFGYGGIAVGDVNNDGRLDVGYGMHHNYSGTDLGDQLMEVALGDGTGASWTPWDDGLATNGEDYGMFTTDFADIDADGDLDIVSGSFGCCNGVHVYRNDGGGSWTQTWARSGGNSYHQLVTGDVNGDGYPDVASSYQYGTIWLGDGEGLFTRADTGLPAAGTSGLPGVALGDVDRDGRADLAICPGGGVKVLLWRTDHWEDASTNLPAAGSYKIAQLWDMNLDGVMDVCAMRGDGVMSVWLGDGAGVWTAGGGFNAPPAADLAAFRVGGDIDHNGYPDVVFLQEEGSWFDYQNHLYVYREGSVPLERFVRLQFPRGNESFFAGSVMVIRWAAAHVGLNPADVDLEHSSSGSDGPWTPIAVGLPDGGHHQWTVAGAPGDQNYVRVTLHQGPEQVSAVGGPFTILPSGSTGVDAPKPAVFVRVYLLENPVIDRARFGIERNGYAPSSERDVIAIYDPAGRHVGRVPLSGGSPEWDLRDPAGKPVPAGVYLARIAGVEAAVRRASTRFVIVR